MQFPSPTVMREATAQGKMSFFTNYSFRRNTPYLHDIKLKYLVHLFTHLSNIKKYTFPLYSILFSIL